MRINKELNVIHVHQEGTSYGSWTCPPPSYDSNFDCLDLEGIYPISK